MQSFTVTPQLRNELIARRGRVHAFETVAPSKTALLVVDMQNYFMEEGQPACCPAARDIVPNINRLAGAVRAKGGQVAWVQMELADTADGPSKWPIYHDYFFTPAKRDAHKQGCVAGSDGVKIYPDLNVEPGDIVTHKRRFSAFIQGSSDLHDRLRAMGIENLLIAGTVTNFCCETSARDAMMLDFKVVMVSDCCAALSDDEHLATLETFIQQFGDVMTGGEVLKALLPSAQ